MKRRSERVADGERDEMVLAKDIKSWGRMAIEEMEWSKNL